MSIPFGLVFIFLEMYLKQESRHGFISRDLNCCVTYNKGKLERLNVLQKRHGKSYQLCNRMMGCFTANFKMPKDIEKYAYDVMLNEKSQYNIYIQYHPLFKKVFIYAYV